jgi:methionine-rich copper-binding protein CopC
MKNKFIAIAAFGLAILVSSNAVAHAILTGSNLKANSIIHELPKLVWLEFDGNLISLGKVSVNKISLKGPSGESTIGQPMVGGARISITTLNRKIKGKYILSWRVVSEDGHPVSGSIKFKVN